VTPVAPAPVEAAPVAPVEPAPVEAPVEIAPVEPASPELGGGLLEPGEGCTPTDPEGLLDPVPSDKPLPRNWYLAGSEHPVTGVPFDEYCYPDFSGVTKAEVKITQTGTRAGDFKAANEAAGYDSTPQGVHLASSPGRYDNAVSSQRRPCADRAHWWLHWKLTSYDRDQRIWPANWRSRSC
jgi:hypothetical protein